MSAEDVVELDIDEVAAGGDGVGRDRDGRVTFVPRTAPGDRVRAAVRERRKDFARAALVAVLHESPERVEAPCPYFRAGSCGGCQWQHLRIGAQRRAKEVLVARALRKLVAGGLVIEPVRTPVPDYRWRRRARLHWFRAPAAGRAEVGFFAPRSNFVTDVETCVQLSERLDAALAQVRRHLGGSLHGRGTLHLLEADEGVHVVVDGACRPGAGQALSREQGIAGVRIGSRTFGAAAVSVDGARAAADDFAQATRAGNDELRRVVGEACSAWTAGARVLELYAGSGNLTAALPGARVVAVDRARPVEPIAGVEFRAGDVPAVVAELAAAGERFDAIVLDPPRQGARDATAGIAELAPAHIVYVSCDVATLARDAGDLVARGYRPVRAVPIDLMPQTSHVEVVMVLRSPA